MKKLFLVKTDKLYNVVLPIFLFEAWYILFALVIVVVIEAFIVSKTLKLTFVKSFNYLLFVNIVTSLFGFLLQGILRMIILMTLTDGNSKILNILLGNFGASESNFKSDIIIELFISLIITCGLSVYIEYKSLKRILKQTIPKNTIFKNILIANSVSYILIFAYLIFILKVA